MNKLLIGFIASLLIIGVALGVLSGWDGVPANLAAAAFQLAVAIALLELLLRRHLQRSWRPAWSHLHAHVMEISDAICTHLTKANDADVRWCYVFHNFRAYTDREYPEKRFATRDRFDLERGSVDSEVAPTGAEWEPWLRAQREAFEQLKKEWDLIYTRVLAVGPQAFDAEDVRRIFELEQAVRTLHKFLNNDKHTEVRVAILGSMSSCNTKALWCARQIARKASASMSQSAALEGIARATQLAIAQAQRFERNPSAAWGQQLNIDPPAR